MNDTWANPTDLAQGPDGAMYISDFFDVRTAHPDPDADWDRSNGRIYKLMAAGAKPAPKIDLFKLSSLQLVELLRAPNRWYADEARLLLASRRDASVLPGLRRMALNPENGRQSLQGLWALYVSGGFNESLAGELLKHPYPYVRSWTVRLLGDAKKVSPAISRQLRDLARTDPAVAVRSQLASTAKRLPAADALPIVTALLDQNKDADDPFIPWQIWWALEEKVFSAKDQILSYFGKPAVWNSRLSREEGLNLIRRYSAEGSPLGYDAAEALLKAAPPSASNAVLEALNRGLSERAGVPKPPDNAFFIETARVERPPQTALREYAPVSGALRAHIAALWTEAKSDPLRAQLALRANVPDVEESLMAQAAGAQRSEDERKAALQVLEQLGSAKIVPSLLTLLDAGHQESIRMAALRGLARFDDPAIAAKVMALYRPMSPVMKSAARELLFGRAASASAFLDQAETDRAVSQDVPPAQIRLIAALSSKDLDARVRKLWGNVGQGTAEEKLAVMRRYSNDLRAAAGDAKAGVRIFNQTCARCHKLYGSGGDLAMELTNANRKDRNYLLTHIVDPSVYIRKEYMSYDARMKNGRVVTGLMAEQDAASVTLMDGEYRKTRLARSDIAKLDESEVSIMPEGLLDKLTPQQLRDLFAYLQSPSKP
jgi:putative heme-binding domain-containing protein